MESSSERIPERCSTVANQLWCRVGKLRQLQKRLWVWDLLQPLSLLKRGAGPALALQEVLARWAPHYAESAPQPPGFAGVTCLLSTVFGCTTLQKDLRVHISLQTVFCPFGNLSFPICNIGHIGIFCMEVCRDLWGKWDRNG